MLRAAGILGKRGIVQISVRGEGWLWLANPASSLIYLALCTLAYRLEGGLPLHYYSAFTLSAKRTPIALMRRC